MNLLFKSFCPSNTVLEHILLKVTALNAFYSTNILSTFPVAKHIFNANIDSRLQAGDPLLVNELAAVTIAGKQKYFYSFASKYCNHHVPESFPIYDSFVEKMLLHFSGTESFAQFTKQDLKNYRTFVQVITDFRKFYSLEQFSLRQIDVYLWLAGKDSFPRKYGKLNRTVTAPAVSVA